jgi:hypothetical protein
MSGWISDLLACLGLLVLALACFQSVSLWIRRLGLWVIFGTIGLGLWFWTKNWGVVVAGLLAWFVIPVGQAMYLSRKLRISHDRKLSQEGLDAEEFAELPDLTRDLRTQGFRLDSDYWLKPSPFDQGYRLFRHEEEGTYAAIAVARQGAVHLSYLLFATPGADGGTWITWDYPLAYGMQMPPHFNVHRFLAATSVKEMHEQHREFLQLNTVTPVTGTEAEDSHKTACRFFEEMFRQTVRHNLEAGLLRRTEGESGDLAYSWRGTFFISWQVLVELVKG